MKTLIIILILTAMALEVLLLSKLLIDEAKDVKKHIQHIRKDGSKPSFDDYWPLQLAVPSIALIMLFFVCALVFVICKL